MRRLLVLLPLGLLLLARAAAAAPDLTPEQARPRVDHHLREVEPLAQHLESVLAKGCPHFATRDAWQAYLDGEIEKVVLMMAHLEQAWVEAKRSPDDETRQAAKAPRKHLDRAQTLLDKLSACAHDNGASFAPTAVWRRIEREVPQRQAEIALPRSEGASPAPAEGSPRK